MAFNVTSSCNDYRFFDALSFNVFDRFKRSSFFVSKWLLMTLYSTSEIKPLSLSCLANSLFCSTLWMIGSNKYWVSGDTLQDYKNNAMIIEIINSNAAFILLDVLFLIMISSLLLIIIYDDVITCGGDVLFLSYVLI